MRYSMIGLAFLQLVSSLAINPRTGVVLAPMWKRKETDLFQSPRLASRNTPGTPLVPLSSGDNQTLYFADSTLSESSWLLTNH